MVSAVDLTQLGKHFIGLWCFRAYSKPRTYAVTLNIRGCYYDTDPQVTPVEAVRVAQRVLWRATVLTRAKRGRHGRLTDRRQVLLPRVRTRR